MDKFMQQMREAFANEALWKEFQTGIWDTIYSTVAATLVACVLGIILGIILVAGEEDGVRPLPGPVMKVLNFAINILRSVPFLILMIMVLPLSELLVGTTIGTVASIPPLIIASASFVARLVETSLREVDKGVIEAAQSMGCSPFQIIWKVILPESLPSLVASFTTAFITILGYGAMAGAIGGGGLGKIAINYGYYKYNRHKRTPGGMLILAGAQTQLICRPLFFVQNMRLTGAPSGCKLSATQAELNNAPQTRGREE